MEDLTLSFETYNAHLVRGVIEATAPPNETVADARMRAGAIIVMFKDFDPVTALESMIACQCIALRFMLMAATRDVSLAIVDVKTQIRMRSSAVAISRALEGWMARFQATQRHNGTRAAEAARKEDASMRVQAEAGRPAPVLSPPVSPETARPRAFRAGSVPAAPVPSKPVRPESPWSASTPPGSVASTPVAPGPAAPSTRNPEPSVAAMPAHVSAASPSSLEERAFVGIGPGEQPRADLLFADPSRPGLSLRDAMLTSTALSHGVSGQSAGGTPSGG